MKKNEALNELWTSVIDGLPARADYYVCNLRIELYENGDDDIPVDVKETIEVLFFNGSRFHNHFVPDAGDKRKCLYFVTDWFEKPRDLRYGASRSVYEQFAFATGNYPTWPNKEDNTSIREFKGAYRWLSNFTGCDIVLDGVTYRSVEHAYMSAKSDDPNWKKFCAETPSPAVVKKASRTIPLVENWNDKKLDVMKECLEQKFSKEPFKTLLKDTGNVELIEGNWWGDTFWGVNLNTGEGQNILGRMIMSIRDNKS